MTDTVEAQGNGLNHDDAGRIYNRLGGIEADLGTLKTIAEGQERRVSILETRTNKGTDWQTILSVIGLFGAMIMFVIQPLTDSLATVQQDAKTMRSELGHRQALIAANNTRADNQRRQIDEMRDWNRRQNDRIRAITEKTAEDRVKTMSMLYELRASVINLQQRGQ
jgi:hypothetical protein